MNEIVSKVKSSYYQYFFAIFLLVGVGRIISTSAFGAKALVVLVIGTTLAWFFQRQILYVAGFSFMCLYGPIMWEISLAHFLIFFLTLVFVLKLALGKETIPKEKIILFSVFFVLFIFLNEAVHSPTYAFGGGFIRKVGRTLIGISAAVLILSTLKNPRAIKALIYSMVIGICISCIVAIFQYYVGEPFWLLREKLGLPNETIDFDRMPGLAADNIQFSFQLCLMIPLIYSLLWYRKNSAGDKAFLVFAFTVTSLALFLNATRSAIVGIVLALFIMSVISKRYHKLSLAIIIIIGLLTLLRPLHPRTFSAIGIPNRIIGYSLAFSSLTEHPLGVGSHQYYSEEADKFLSEIPIYPWAKVSYAPHNSLLNIGTYYGFPGLFLCLVFYYWVFKRILELRKRLEDPFLSCINVGILCSFISYLVNTSFHNRGFFNGEHFGWFFVGILLFLSHFQKRKMTTHGTTTQLRGTPSG